MQKHLGKEYIDAFWPIAAKHGFTPIIGRPDEGTSESWHFDHRGPWLPVFKHLGSEAGSLCCTLDVGQAGEFQSDAALIQALLLRAGYDIGAPDGQLGKRSKAALAALNLTGKATEDTILALRGLPWGTGSWIAA